MPTRRQALSCTAFLLMGAATAPTPAGVPVILQSQPGTPLDAIARGLAAPDLAQAQSAGEAPLVLAGTARLGSATDRPAVFVQLQSPRECGSAGCSIAVHAWIGGGWRKVLDSAGGALTVLPARTRGMADLAAGTEHYAWTGREYRNLHPAPTVDLRPRQPRH